MYRTDKLVAIVGTLVAAAAASALELIDPMQPPAPPPTPLVEESPLKPGAWRLGAIKIEPGRRSAMINGKIVVEGEEVDGARVVSIASRRVEIAIGNETTSLSLLQHEIDIHPTAAR